MSKYLITLTPMGSYYFGGERSFSVGSDDNNELASYIIESNLFPQQTSLLGMLRFWILKNSDAFNVAENKISDSVKAKTIIGEKSFSIDSVPFDKHGNSRFGKIKEIGFCFLQKEKEKQWIDILPAPLDYALKFDFSKTENAFYNGKAKTLPEIRYSNHPDSKKDNNLYTDKDGLVKGYIDANGKFYNEDDIFIKDQRIGINRDIKTGEVEEDALYKQIFCRLKNGFRFAFVAEFADDFNLPSKEIVELGGDSSKFVLEYKSLGSMKEPCYDEKLLGGLDSKEKSYFKLILLSDTKIENTFVEQYATFSITEHIPFRFLTFNIATTNYSRLGNPVKSKDERYSLFKRGSVFFFEDENKLEQLQSKIDENKTLKQIGYNNIQIGHNNINTLLS